MLLDSLAGRPAPRPVNCTGWNVHYERLMPAKTILLVDDDPGFLLNLSGVLTKAGYQVVAALTGHEAWKILERDHATIDLLIVDLVLPDIHGLEIIGAVTRRPSRLKIIAASSVMRDSFLETVRYLGAHETLRKPPLGSPVIAEDWLRVVRNMLDGEADIHLA